MPKYMLIYLTQTVWPIDGQVSRMAMCHFDYFEMASHFADDLEDMWPDWQDIQIYEYTGIQYVLVERRHKK